MTAAAAVVAALARGPARAVVIARRSGYSHGAVYVALRQLRAARKVRRVADGWAIVTPRASAHRTLEPRPPRESVTVNARSGAWWCTVTVHPWGEVEMGFALLDGVRATPTAAVVERLVADARRRAADA